MKDSVLSRLEADLKKYLAKYQALQELPEKTFGQYNEYQFAPNHFRLEEKVAFYKKWEEGYAKNKKDVQYICSDKYFDDLRYLEFYINAIQWELRNSPQAKAYVTTTHENL